MLRGINGQIHLYADKIVISRNGFFGRTNFIFNGDKTIMLNKIGSVQFKKSVGIIFGYFQLSIMGGIEGAKGYMEIGKDENAVMFSSKENKNALQFK